MHCKVNNMEVTDDQIALAFHEYESDRNLYLSQTDPHYVEPSKSNFLDRIEGLSNRERRDIYFLLQVGYQGLVKLNCYYVLLRSFDSTPTIQIPPEIRAIPYQSFRKLFSVITRGDFDPTHE